MNVDRVDTYNLNGCFCVAVTSVSESLHSSFESLGTESWMTMKNSITRQTRLAWPIVYYSKIAKDHTMFVMEQSWNGSHPETHWMHETPLPGCDCITWVTYKLLTVVAAGNWTDWEICMTWSNIMKPPFWGYGENLYFWGSASLMTEHMLPIVHIWYIVMKFSNKNMSSN